MTSITLANPHIGAATPADLAARLRPLLDRLAAWRRYRNYPTMRRTRREAVFTWSAEVVRHASGRH